MAMNRNYTLRQLRGFIETFEAGAFTLAAERMGISQPSLSVLVKELEGSLGATLFDRTTRRCVPTDAAQSFYDKLKQPLSQIERAWDHAQDVGRGVSGRLRLAALPSMASGSITRKLAEFRRSRPDIYITLVERRHDQQLAAVLRGDVEFGITSMSNLHPEITFQSLYVDRLMIVVPSGHPLADVKVTWEALNMYPLILVSSGQAEDAMRAEGVRIVPVCDVEQAVTALSMVRSGMGITVLSSSILPDLDMSGLAYLPIHGSSVYRTIGIIRRRDTRLSKVALSFVRTLRYLAPPQFSNE
jgi:LysR family carnitine catabolism transcriptional activator